MRVRLGSAAPALALAVAAAAAVSTPPARLRRALPTAAASSPRDSDRTHDPQPHLHPTPAPTLPLSLPYRLDRAPHTVARDAEPPTFAHGTAMTLAALLLRPMTQIHSGRYVRLNHFRLRVEPAQLQFASGGQ